MLLSCPCPPSQQDGGITARQILLNGKELELLGGGNVPEFVPETAPPRDTLTLDGYNMAFWVFPAVRPSFCRSGNPV